ncbi:GTP 3',8-cyclase MoaA [Paenibacillus crassostreae]|uniref:GTP 3',8-cyclase n=1 Tax=Paenibacillus crassostreae TaxID=1763538 RepID=A0A167DKQ7_9BACL|nr:GTP 3',8-cyclase MoaA [Paenibacillus crassostreae]AOZ91339.1 cyclic pyranopterin phosphate synthase [Paenibacillus crassostreae]OAB74502.1 cyclic pyranopterin phosphate synthase MoaA [Paenibacillus crassostreae]
MSIQTLIDPFGRKHDYLRISVTDRCNLRCIYCMPEEGMEFEPAEHLLSYEEITDVVRILAGMGVRKLRLTGGEPLVRKELDVLVAMLSQIPGIEDIALTTNAIFLAPRAARLKEAGLTRVNISLDSLQPERFKSITRGGDIKKVLASIDECIRVGLSPIKLNVVLMKGINDDEIADFLALTMDREINVRFIEYMPIGHHDSQWKSLYFSLDRVFEVCAEKGWSYEAASSLQGNGPSDNYTIAGAKGSFGLIHPISNHFCKTCNRLRLTADGVIKPCLAWSEHYQVRNVIGDDEAVRQLFLEALGTKPESHEMSRHLLEEQTTHTPTMRRMSQIGG